MSDGVLEMRLVVTAPDYEAALAFYRDMMGMREIAAFTSPGARMAILAAGRATLELADPPHAAYVDEVEVGRRVAGHVRVALQVRDAAAATERAVSAGAVLVAAPSTHRGVRSTPGSRARPASSSRSSRSSMR